MSAFETVQLQSALRSGVDDGLFFGVREQFERLGEQSGVKRRRAGLQGRTANKRDREVGEVAIICHVVSFRHKKETGKKTNRQQLYLIGNQYTMVFKA